MTAVYYNENNPKAAALLRRRMEAGRIPAGDIDDRSIEDVRAVDLAGYEQCHFFAGIGGWPLALRMAGWQDDWSVWTGSAPCQPFSVAGKRRGVEDERHLWPAFRDLIRERGPAVVLGEQVASADGRAWFDAVSADLEDMGFAVGAADLCAAGIGAPHIRQRLYWVADAYDAGLEGREADGRRADQRAFGSDGVAGGMADADSGRQQARGRHDTPRGHRISLASARGIVDGLSDFWRNPEWVYCRSPRDGEPGQWRPVERGLEPLAHGFPGRTDEIEGYGNAIVPQLAAAFILAWRADDALA